MIRFEHVSKRYPNGHDALKQVSFELGDGEMVFITGHSGAGKSTLARGLEQRLQQVGKKTILLDGDIMRSGLNRDLGFSDEDRTENIRRMGEVNRLFFASCDSAKHNHASIRDFVPCSDERRHACKVQNQ